MLWEAKLTNGIGARIAHNTPCMSTRDALGLDLVLTSANNAKQNKTTKSAQHKDLENIHLNIPFQQDI